MFHQPSTRPGVLLCGGGGSSGVGWKEHSAKDTDYVFNFSLQAQENINPSDSTQNYLEAGQPGRPSWLTSVHYGLWCSVV